MKNNLHALLIALMITGTGIAYTLYTSKSTTGDIQGASVATMESTPENQSARLPESKTNFDTLLVNTGKKIGLTIIEIVDASFPWETDDNVYEVVGKSITIDNAQLANVEMATNYLIEKGFTKNGANTYSRDNKDNLGYYSNDDVCIIRTSTTEKETDEIATKLTVMCGLIDYKRVIN